MNRFEFDAACLFLLGAVFVGMAAFALSERARRLDAEARLRATQKQLETMRPQAPRGAKGRFTKTP